jgi:16S rRNA (cytosine1402-N4)-methyltransferase
MMNMAFLSTLRRKNNLTGTMVMNLNNVENDKTGNSDSVHLPAMLEEVMEFLKPHPGSVIVDCTLGGGGHARSILEKIVPDGFLIGIERDPEIMEFARKRLAGFENNCHLLVDNFKNLDDILDRYNIKRVDGILFDLGVSSFHLDMAERGFSFRFEGPLDMRYDRRYGITAFDLVNNLNAEELSNIFRRYGEERWANRIARAIVEERKKYTISTTSQLVQLITKVVPFKRYNSNIHPATRVFQALRILVNRELDNLDQAVDKAINFLLPGGRICVISFHSLEDRLVKRKFREFNLSGDLKIITKKPIFASELETGLNPRVRSARLRVAESVT